MDHPEIVDRYTYARLENDAATVDKIFRQALAHDKAHPSRPPLRPLLLEVAFRIPMNTAS